MDQSTKTLERVRLTAIHGQVYDTEELRKEFKVVGFLAPYVTVIRQIDGVKGMMEFTHMPRFYFAFHADAF